MIYKAKENCVYFQQSLKSINSATRRPGKPFLDLFNQNIASGLQNMTNLLARTIIAPISMTNIEIKFIGAHSLKSPLLDIDSSKK